MSLPDFVQFTLDTLDTNWNTANYDPKPVLIDRRDGDVQNSTRRSRSHELKNGNAISVSAAPTRTNEAIGTAFDYRFRAGVSVRIEGLHEAEHGHIADAADFESLVTEAKRAIHAERVEPTANDNVRSLTVEEENDVSSDTRDQYRTDLTVWFDGFETLP